MKIYVDELPKSCSKCEFCDKDNGLCNILGQCFRDGYDYSDCPLQSLADHDKQVRNEVCEEIRKFIHSGEYDNFGIEYLRTGLAVLEKLDQIQGETK